VQTNVTAPFVISNVSASDNSQGTGRQANIFYNVQVTGPGSSVPVVITWSLQAGGSAVIQKNASEIGEADFIVQKALHVGPVFVNSSLAFSTDAKPNSGGSTGFTYNPGNVTFAPANPWNTPGTNTPAAGFGSYYNGVFRTDFLTNESYLFIGMTAAVVSLQCCGDGKSSESAYAIVDPAIAVDGSLVDPSLYTVSTSPGVGNFPDRAAVLSAGVGLPGLVAVPGPAIGAGLPGLIAACGSLLVWWRKKRRAGEPAIPNG
jgi:hypothetical protein